MRLPIEQTQVSVEQDIRFAVVNWDSRTRVGIRADSVMMCKYSSVMCKYLYGSYLCIFVGRFVETGVCVRTKFVFKKPAGSAFREG